MHRKEAGSGLRMKMRQRESHSTGGKKMAVGFEKPAISFQEPDVKDNTQRGKRARAGCHKERPDSRHMGDTRESGGPELERNQEGRP